MGQRNDGIGVESSTMQNSDERIELLGHRRGFLFQPRRLIGFIIAVQKKQRVPNLAQVFETQKFNVVYSGDLDQGRGRIRRPNREGFALEHTGLMSN